MGASVGQLWLKKRGREGGLLPGLAWPWETARYIELEDEPPFLYSSFCIPNQADESSLPGVVGFVRIVVKLRNRSFEVQLDVFRWSEEPEECWKG